MKSAPLLSWDLYSESFFKSLQQAQKRSDRLAVESFAKKYSWKNDIQKMMEDHDYEAIVITDSKLKIIWVNDGFSHMTGYPKKFALNKTPHFLQGEETSQETKHRIRKKINKDEPFQDVVINYKKDQSTYKCEVKIFPLYHEETTHFIALERKIG